MTNVSIKKNRCFALKGLSWFPLAIAPRRVEKVKLVRTVDMSTEILKLPKNYWAEFRVVVACRQWPAVPDTAGILTIKTCLILPAICGCLYLTTLPTYQYNIS